MSAKLCGFVAWQAALILLCPLPSSSAANVVVSFNSGVARTNFPNILTNVVAIAAGDHHQLALNANGSVFAWGFHPYESMETQTNVPPEVTNVVAIAAGSRHSLALREDGTVVAWGGSGPEIAVPSGLSDLVAIACGSFHSLGLRRDGTVVAWPANYAAPAELRDVVGVAGGMSHSSALRADGSVVGWGGGACVPENWTNVVAVAAGRERTVALMGDSTVEQCSGGYSGAAPNLSNAVAISSGIDGTIALKADGTAIGWGFNFYGESVVPPTLSNIVAVAQGWSTCLTIVGEPGPSLLTGPPFLTRPVYSRTIEIGGSTDFVITATGSKPLLYQWQFRGTNVPGATNAVLTLSNVQPHQAGTYSVLAANAFDAVKSMGATMQVVPAFITLQPADQQSFLGGTIQFAVTIRTTAPTALQWQKHGADLQSATSTTLVLTNVQLSDAGEYSLIASNVYGTVETRRARLTVVNVAGWGENDFGQLNIPDDLTNIVHVGGRGLTGLAVRDSGTVVAWGRNAYGEAQVPEDLTNALSVTGMAAVSIALRNDGTVTTWGTRFSGAIPAPELTNVVAVETTARTSLALLDDGTLVAWGPGATNVPLGLSNLVAIALKDYGLALREDGTVVAWQDNPDSAASGAEVPPGLSNLVAIATGLDHSLALQSDGTVVGWGEDHAGQISVFQGVSNFVAIAAGWFHSAGLKADGTVVASTNLFGFPGSAPDSLRDVQGITAGSDYVLAVIGSGPPTTRARLMNPTLTPEGFTVEVPSQNGLVYRLEYADSSPLGPWKGLRLHAGTGKLLPLRDPIVGRERFYRVRRW